MKHSTISEYTVTAEAYWASEPATLSPATVIQAEAETPGMYATWIGSLSATPNFGWTDSTPVGTASVTVTAAGSLARETTLSFNVQ